jgi:hypothetical protein
MIVKSKIIELSGNKLRDLRMNYQKLQAQNWNLAQSNSQMLAVCFFLALIFKANLTSYLSDIDFMRSFLFNRSLI